MFFGSSPDRRIVVTVTVIIPAHNAAAYLKQAVDSALGQRGVDVEVIVIDDGSTDETWDVMKGYGDAIRTARVVKGGPYKARNHGARLAAGVWLAFLDADDEWLPDKLAKQLALTEDGTEFVYTDCINFGEATHHKERESDSQRLWEGDVFEPLLLANFITLSSVLISRTAFERLGGFSEDLLGVMDWDLWLRYTAQGGRASSLPRAIDPIPSACRFGQQQRRGEVPRSVRGSPPGPGTTAGTTGEPVCREPGPRQRVGDICVVRRTQAPRAGDWLVPPINLLLALEDTDRTRRSLKCCIGMI